MAREIGKLVPVTLNKIKQKGMYPDGGNLYLQVTDAGVKSWIFRYMIDGKSRSMGLGPLNALSLADARMLAAECRKQLSQGIDPLAARRAEQAKVKLLYLRNITFKQCAEAYIEAHKSGWRNAKHASQWTNTLTTYAYPTIGGLMVQDVDVGLVLKVLEPIWKTKTETADRLRGRIEAILDWASSREYRTGDNPARWRGKLQNLLPARSKIQQVKHHPALPYDDISEFVAALELQEGLAAEALKMVILTATRTSETINAKWDEFDLKNKLWVIPANRIKTGKEHRVPLSESVLKILKELHEKRINDHVFPSRNGKSLSNMAMLVLLRRMKRDDITVHGFRSTFRDWAAEQTNYAREVAEAALSHAVGNAVEAAYRRGDLFEKRRKLMNEWARYCYQPKTAGKVIKMRA
ncbi:MAG: tyrosine-type recombinase/integrase [Hyphomicrobiales bacterium]|nr:tyrosine-type recombinase/integrase [Hyphomicrobiales bacterium]